MDAKSQRAIRNRISIVYGINALVAFVITLAGFLSWLCKCFIGLADFSWQAAVAIAIGLLVLGAVAYAILSVVWEELDNDQLTHQLNE